MHDASVYDERTLMDEWHLPSDILKCPLPIHIDIDECQDEKVCGQNATCINTQGSYFCVCNAGFGVKSGKSMFYGNQEKCEGEDYKIMQKNIYGFENNKH